ncbi:MAG: response regulator, partial [Cohnella sp.]|nr:response regulator [Cohnella sp.]
MKITIADDEQLVRIGLISMLEELEVPCEVVGEAATGQELIELVQTYKPELAIVDIRMPECDGLEAIQRSRALSPHTKWIILSGYSDFQYAQQALKLGVTEYLLKPVAIDDLERIIRAVGQHSREYAASLNRRFETELFSLCHGLISTASEPKSSGLWSKGVFQGLCYEFDVSRTVHETEWLIDLLGARVRERMNEWLTSGLNTAWFSLSGAEYVFTIAWESGNLNAQRKVKPLIEAIEQIMIDFRGRGLAVSGVSTESCAGFEAYIKQMQRIQTQMGLRTLYGFDQTVRSLELDRFARVESLVKIGRAGNQLAQHYKNRLYVPYNQAIDELDMAFNQGGSELDDVLTANFRQFLLTAIGIDFAGEDNNVRKWSGSLRAWGEIHLLPKKSSMTASRDLVEEVIAYLDQNYAGNIGLAQIAGDLNVTPNYLSAQFHKKTGVTFVKYLARLRITKAKELLLQS